MSIASEIEDLNTNLTAAKNAVTTAGGTVGDTGLAGLAEEISSIPSGETVPPYGKVEYYYDVRAVYSANGMMCTATITDADAFGDFYEMAFGSGGGMSQLMYQNGNWMYYDWEDPDDPEKIIPDISAIGLSVVFDDPDNPAGEIMCSKTMQVYPDTGTQTVDLDTVGKFNSLASAQDGYYVVGDVSIFGSAIKKYTFGSSVTTVPDNFFNQTSANYLTDIDYTNATNVTSIGNNVKFYAKSRAVFPALTTIGNNVTFYSASIDMPELLTVGNTLSLSKASEVILPKVTSIGNAFSAPLASYIGMSELATVGNNFSAPVATWLYFEKLVTIGNNFLLASRQIKIAITLGPISGPLTTIGTDFLRGGNFSSITGAAPTPGSATSTGLVLPSSITSIGVRFMSECLNFCGTIVAACPASVVQTQTSEDYINLSEARMNSTASKSYIYAVGFTFSGAQKSSWASRFGTMGGTRVGTLYYFRRSQAV